MVHKDSDEPKRLENLAKIITFIFFVFLFSLSFIAAYTKQFGFTFPKMLAYAVEVYGGAVNSITAFIEFLILPLSRKIGISINESWKGVFGILFLYISKDVWTGYIKRKDRTIPLILSAIVAATITLIGFPIAVGILVTESTIQSTTFIAAIGFFMYELIKAPMTASYLPNREKSWGQTFYHYLRYAFSNVIIGGFLLLILNLMKFSATLEPEFIGVFFLVLLGIRNYILSVKRILSADSSHKGLIKAYLDSASVNLANLIMSAFIISLGISFFVSLPELL